MRVNRIRVAERTGGEGRRVEKKEKGNEREWYIFF